MLRDGGRNLEFFEQVTGQIINDQLNLDIVDIDRLALEVESPADTVFTPFQQQLDAYIFIRSRMLNGFNVLLHGDTGSGKTKTALDVASNLPDVKSILIVCPKAVIPVWRYQITLHVKHPEHFEYTIVNYENLNKIYDSYDFIILDESHKIKNPQAKRTKLAYGLTARYKLCLTATPMPNGNPVELYSQLYFLEPYIYGDINSFRFRNRFCEFGGYRNKEIVGVRKDKEQIFNTYRTITCRMSAPVRDNQETIDNIIPIPANKALAQHLEHLHLSYKLAMEADRTNECRKWNTYQQIATSGRHSTSHILLDRSKIDTFDEITKESEDSNFVIFYKYNIELNDLLQKAADQHVKVFQINGRYNQYEEWKANPTGWLLVQLSAGETGIDLTEYHKVIYYSMSYDPSVMTQSLARVNRTGQEKVVHVYYLVLENEFSIDQKILRSLERKMKSTNQLLVDTAVTLPHKK